MYHHCICAAAFSEFNYVLLFRGGGNDLYSAVQHPLDSTGYACSHRPPHYASLYERTGRGTLPGT
jgi:hypothetical protein